MTQTKVMKKAAALFAEWKDGDEFEPLYLPKDLKPFVFKEGGRQ